MVLVFNNRSPYLDWQILVVVIVVLLQKAISIPTLVLYILMFAMDTMVTLAIIICPKSLLDIVAFSVFFTYFMGFPLRVLSPEIFMVVK